MTDLTGLVLAGFIGGAVTVLLLGVLRRMQTARTGRALARALEREMETGRFERVDDEVHVTAFRSAVFDTWYPELIRNLPERLVHDLAEYYADVKHAWKLRLEHRAEWTLLQGFLGDAPTRRADLLLRVRDLAERSRLSWLVGGTEAMERSKEAVARAHAGIGRRRLWIRLTEEQKAGIKEATGKDAEGIRYTPEELEIKLAHKLPKEEHLHGLWVALGLDE